MKLIKRNQVEASDNIVEQQVTEEENSGKKDKKPGKRYSVYVYGCIMLIAIVAVILLSYFMQERSSRTISSLTEQHNEFSIAALQNIEDLQSKNILLQEQVSQLEEERDALTEEINEKEKEWKEQKIKTETENSAEYEKLQEKFDVIKNLLDMKLDVEKGDTAAASARAAQIEPKKSLLNDEYASLYQELLKTLD